MSSLEIDTGAVELGSLLQVSLNCTFDPLKQVLAYVVRQLKDNSAAVTQIREQLSASKYSPFPIRG